MAKKESCLLILVKMALLTSLLLVGAIVGFYYIKGWLNDFFNRGETVEVPDFRGKHLLAVFKEKPPELIIEKRDEKYDPRFPKDYVIAQYPDPGTRVKPNKKVLLTISMGSKMVIVPDLIDKTLREAELALINAQLKEGNRAYITSKIRRDHIITQSPLPATEYEVQGSVDLLVSLGTAQTRFHIPSLAGKNLEDAKVNLQGWGLRLGKVLFKRDPNRPALQVISTRPTPYSLISEGVAVDLLVSNGNGPDSAPASEYKIFEFVDTVPTSVSNAPPAPAQAKTPVVAAPPRILIGDEVFPIDSKQLSQKPETDERQAEPQANPAVQPMTSVTFVMPDGFMEKEVKFFQVSPQGRRQVYAGRHKPLERISVDVPKIAGSKVQIYINDVPIEDRQIQ